jgi:hypothetical protein
MQLEEVVAQLNTMNLQVAEFQKTLVRTLSTLQRSGLQQPSGNVDLTLPNGRTLSSDKVIAGMRAQSQQQGQPQHEAELSAISPEVATALALRVVGEHLAPKSDVTDVAAAPTLTKISTETGPTLVQAATDSIVAGALERDQELRLKLRPMIFGPDGMLAHHFGERHYPVHGHGPLQARPGINQYVDDVSKLSWERLARWPSGFYIDQDHKGDQFMIQNREFIAIIQFRVLNAQDHNLEDTAIDVIFKNSGIHRRMHLMKCQPALIHSILEKLNHELSVFAAHELGQTQVAIAG